MVGGDAVLVRAGVVGVEAVDAAVALEGVGGVVVEFCDSSQAL